MQKSHSLSDHAADTRVAIVGGGPAGSLLALALAQRGYSVDVYELRSDPRQQIAGRGKSINLLSFSTNLTAGWRRASP